MAKARKARSSLNGKITHKRLLELVSYDPETGHFTWKPRGLYKWDPRWAGKRAGFFNSIFGYWYVQIVGCGSFRANRLAWFYMTGEWPGESIDHINGVTDDDRFSNLRKATLSQNQHNRKKAKNNKSGHVGVSWREDKKRWRAFICLKGKSIHLGYFHTEDMAIKAREEAVKQYHGEFARVE